MDLNEELAHERARRIKVEEELGEWHRNLAKTLSPEQLAAAIEKQQLEALTFHLYMQRRITSELEAKYMEREKELALVVENVKSLEKRLGEKDREIEKLRNESEKLQKSAKAAEPPLKGQRFNASWIPSDEELDNILSAKQQVPTPEKAQAGGVTAQKAPKEPKSFKDFIQLVRRMERIKLYDAALLMDMPQDDIIVWARALERKGYLTVHGLREKTLIATDKMLKTR